MFWLMKSEPACWGIDDLARDGRGEWTGVRNYQVRNFIRDRMRPGDRAFLWHSSCREIGLAGEMDIASAAYPDPTQFDPDSRYFDPKATPDQPRWYSVDVSFVTRYPQVITMAELRAVPELATLQVLAPGSRLSAMPVDPAHWKLIHERWR